MANIFTLFYFRRAGLFAAAVLSLAPSALAAGKVLWKDLGNYLKDKSSRSQQRTTNTMGFGSSRPRALLRRSAHPHGKQDEMPDELRLGEIVVDFQSYEVGAPGN